MRVQIDTSRSANRGVFCAFHVFRAFGISVSCIDELRHDLQIEASVCAWRVVAVFYLRGKK